VGRPARPSGAQITRRGPTPGHQDTHTHDDPCLPHGQTITATSPVGKFCNRLPWPTAFDANIRDDMLPPVDTTEEDGWWAEGHAARRRGELSEARDAYERAANAARDAHRPEREMEARLYAADCARRLGQREASSDQLHLAVQVGRQRGFDGLLARALGELGSLAVAAGDVQVGAAWYREALELARGAGDERAEATQLGNLGLMALQRGDHDTARGLLRERLDKALGMRAVDAAADTLTSLAEVEIASDNPTAAEKALHQSLSLRRGRRTVGAVRGLACSLVLLTRLARARGKHTEALALAERALQAATAAKAGREAAHAHLLLGHLANDRGDRTDAKAHLEHAAEGLRRSGDVLQGLVADVALASVAVDDGDYQAAHDAYTRAAAGFRDNDNPGAAIDAVQVAAQLDARMGRLTEAEAALRSALEEAQALEYEAAIARIEVNLASAQVVGGHTEAGVAGCLAGARRFEALGRIGDQAMALLGAGEALVIANRLEAADTIFTECETLLRDLGDERGVRVVAAWRCHVRLLRDGRPEDAAMLGELGTALEAAGDLAAALRHRMTLATLPGAEPALAQQVAERAEAVGLWPLATEARALLLAGGEVETLAAEAEARGYVTLAQCIRSREA
jgi:tetratricopeptide (TPR) repeat protein